MMYGYCGIGFVLAFTACGTDGVATGGGDSTSQALSHGQEVPPMVGDDWIGYKLGASPGTWRYLGDMKVAARGARTSRDPVFDPDAPDAPNGSPDTIGYGDVESRRMYEVDMTKADLEKVATAMEALGYAEGHNSQGTEAANEEVPKSWSGRQDDRVIRDLAHYPVSTAPQFTAIGRVFSPSNYCTGTFVGSPDSHGRRYVMTAAHCLWTITDPPGATTFTDPDFYPRQDGSTSPYGGWNTIAYMIYFDFQQGGVCAGLGTLPTGCLKQDIALLRVAPIGGASANASMGFQAYLPPIVQLFQTAYHRGYPVCGFQGDPDGCVVGAFTLYGDSAIAQMLSYPGTESSSNPGYFQGYYHSSDTSGGHSGGPVYQAGDVFAVNSSAVSGCDAEGRCGAHPELEAHPNVMTALTPNFRNSMLTFMSQ